MNSINNASYTFRYYFLLNFFKIFERCRRIYYYITVERGLLMEIFLDTADVEVVEKYKEFIDGVTTNPSIIAKRKEKNVEDTILQMCNMVSGPVSVEVISLKTEGMVDEGDKISKIHSNVCVKLPCTFDGLKACKILSQKGISTNLTLCFSAAQAILAAKCGATYVSPFIGRIDDAGQNGINLIEEIVEIYDIHGFETKVLSASIRNINHFIQSAIAGSDAVTLPEKVLSESFIHPLTDVGLKKFISDWNKSKK